MNVLITCMNAWIACMNALTACMNPLIVRVDSLHERLDRWHERVACRRTPIASQTLSLRDAFVIYLEIRRTLRHVTGPPPSADTRRKKSQTFVKMGPEGYTVERQRCDRRANRYIEKSCQLNGSLPLANKYMYL